MYVKSDILEILYHEAYEINLYVKINQYITFKIYITVSKYC